LVERSPEKAGVGGSIPSLATMFPITYGPSDRRFHSKLRRVAVASADENALRRLYAENGGKTKFQDFLRT
jgi:hypothetical protein